MITIVTASIPPRAVKLQRAAESVASQTVECQHIHEVDHDRQGPAAMRNHLLEQVTTPFVGFLDDDDYLYPEWAERHLRVLDDPDVCVAYSHFDHRRDDTKQKAVHMVEAQMHKGFNPDILRQKNYIPVTMLVRTKCAQQSSFGPLPGHPILAEEYGFQLRMLDNGCKFEYISERLWQYTLGGNTSGRTDRW